MRHGLSTARRRSTVAHPSSSRVAPSPAPGLGAGPLASALGSLAGGLEPAAGAPGAPRSSGAAARADAASLLAGLMDLRASVQLAADLASLPGVVCPRPEPRAPESVRSLVKERGAELAARVEQGAKSALHTRHKLPTAAAMFGVLEDWGALEKRSGRPLTAAIEALYAPFGVFAANQIERARASARAVREEIGPALGAVSPGAARLERLDAALGAATERGRVQRIGRLLPRISADFADRLRAAVQALPPDARADHLDPWFAPGGCVREHLAAVSTIVLAVLHHEQSRLDALTEAVCRAASE